MKKLFLIITSFIFTLSGCYATFNTIEFDRDLREYASKSKVPFNLLKAVCYERSYLNPKLIGDSGLSIGLCQIRLPTARDRGYMGNKIGLLNARTNIKYSSRQLAWCRSKTKNWSQAIDCYGRGFSKVKHYKTLRDYLDVEHVFNVFLRSSRYRNIYEE